MSSSPPPAAAEAPASTPPAPQAPLPQLPTLSPPAPPPQLPTLSPPSPISPVSSPPPPDSSSPPSDSASPPPPPSTPSDGGGSTPSAPSGGGSQPSGPPDGGSTPTVPSGGGSRPAEPSSGKGTPSTEPPSTSVSTPLAVGLAVGGVAVLVLLGVLWYCCFKKKKERRDFFPPPQPPLPLKDNPYGAQPLNWQQFNTPPPPTDHVVQIPSRPPPHSSGLGLSSSGGSGSDYSMPGYPNKPPSPNPNSYGFSSKSTFTYEELAMATDGFSNANLLGQGGFGYVHRGLLPNGKEVAVKQLKAGSGQGEREFQAEVEIISRVHHKHLVSLVGYCISGGQRLLVYEFVPNNTLEFHLHGKGRPTLDWPIRLKIALGSAKGLAYLHEDCHPKIIHRDIKAANILLDFNFEAKVADFGLAKIASDNNTHVSTRVMGTFGYLAPEYASSGKLTDRSDVFSFGIMLLELITGRCPVDSNHSFMDDSLVDWARPLLTRALEDGVHDSLVDPRLGKNYNSNEMALVIACAAASVRHSARRRPKMSQIVRTLEGDVSLEDLNDGVRPGHSRVYGSYSSTTDYDSGQYNEDMKKFRKMALASNTYASSEYSALTSEYGQNLSASSSEGHQTQEIEMNITKKDSRGFFD